MHNSRDSIRSIFIMKTNTFCSILTIILVIISGYFLLLHPDYVFGIKFGFYGINKTYYVSCLPTSLVVINFTLVGWFTNRYKKLGNYFAYKTIYYFVKALIKLTCRTTLKALLGMKYENTNYNWFLDC